MFEYLCVSAGIPPQIHKHSNTQTPKHKSNMYKYILQSVENINWLAVASLVIFFVIFIISALWAFLSKKEFVDRMANMPLEDDE